jgi:hypothetical protein
VTTVNGAKTGKQIIFLDTPSNLNFSSPSSAFLLLFDLEDDDASRADREVLPDAGVGEARPPKCGFCASFHVREFEVFVTTSMS